MRQRILAAAAVSLAIAAQPAMSQTTTAPSGGPEPKGPAGPAATPSPPSSGTTTTSPPAATTTITPPKDTAAAPTGGDMFYTHQSGEVRASRLIGTTVRNAAGESIGDINDVVLGTDGQVRAVILGVGGFLGLGEREVAVTMKALQLQSAQSGTSNVTVDATRETLKDAPRWSWTGDSQPAGSGGGSGTSSPTPKSN